MRMSSAAKNWGHLTLLLVKFSCFCCPLLTFLMFSKNSFRNTIIVLNDLDPYQD